jgi:hypothetical protein
MAPTGHGEPPRMHAWVGSPPLGAVVRQSPPHVMVCVHVDPVGQGSPPTMHEAAAERINGSKARNKIETILIDFWALVDKTI